MPRLVVANSTVSSIRTKILKDPACRKKSLELDMVTFHYERQPQTEAIPYGELLHAAPSVAPLTYDGRTANLCLDKSSSCLPLVSVHTADLLLHTKVWTYDSAATDGAVGNRIGVMGA